MKRIFLISLTLCMFGTAVHGQSYYSQKSINKAREYPIYTITP